MDGTGRGDAPFSGRVWQEIDRTIAAIRAANCTARRFLDIDGPYGMGLTSVTGDEEWLPPRDEFGASYKQWDVPRPEPPPPGTAPVGVRGGTFLVSGESRAVPLIASEFRLGVRAVEAYEAGCQPLDLRHA